MSVCAFDAWHDQSIAYRFYKVAWGVCAKVFTIATKSRAYLGISSIVTKPTQARGRRLTRPVLYYIFDDID